MARATTFLVALLVVGGALFAVVSPAAAAKKKPCWEQVLDDWSQDGQIDGAYSARCIEEALAKVPEDIRAYSAFEEQAKAARQAASRSLQGRGGAPGAGAAGGGLSEREPDAGPKDESPVGWALRTGGNDADAIPLPLLILLIFAGALIAAGGVGFGARKLKARRAAQAP